MKCRPQTSSTRTLFYDKKWVVWSGLVGRNVMLSYDKLQPDDGETEGRASFSVSFEFSVSLPEVQRRTLDVAVKNSGGFLSKDKGLLGKVSLGRPSETAAPPPASHRPW